MHAGSRDEARTQTRTRFFSPTIETHMHRPDATIDMLFIVVSHLMLCDMQEEQRLSTLSVNEFQRFLQIKPQPPPPILSSSD